MSQPQTIKKSSVIKQDNWEQSYDVVTHNDVIDAYLKGKEVGRDETKLAKNRLFQSNLTKAQDNSEKLYEYLKKIGIFISEIHLKADSLTDFMALIVAKPDDYVSAKFLKAMSLGREIKAYTQSDDFSIDFYFTYKADTLNEGCLSADGYFLKYNANT